MKFSKERHVSHLVKSLGDVEDGDKLLTKLPVGP